MEFTTGHFQPVIEDSAVDPEGVRRIVLCTGKIYYDLLAHREAVELRDTALVRVEQLYPLPVAEIQAMLASVAPETAMLRWIQEEPGGIRARVAVHRNEPAGAFARTALVGGLPAGFVGTGGGLPLGPRIADEQQLVVEQTFAD